jgi:hypothetical protein
MLTRTLALLTTTVTTFLVGCSNAHKYEFAVNIKNDTPEPVTVWLTKQGGPPEEGWLSPEAVESTRPAKLGHINGVVVPAGKTGNLPSLAGRFEPDALAILRVYAGQLMLDQILATPEDGKLRIDVPLREGMNELIVTSNLPLKVRFADEAK